MAPHHGPDFQPKQGGPWVWILFVQGTWEMQQEEKRKGLTSRGWQLCSLPAPSQLFEALNNLNNGSEGRNKRWQGELVEGNKIFLFFFPSPHERRQTATYNERCESLRQKKPTKPQRVCSCNGCAAALLHPFPVLLPSPHGRHYTPIYS